MMIDISIISIMKYEIFTQMIPEDKAPIFPVEISNLNAQYFNSVIIRYKS